MAKGDFLGSWKNQQCHPGLGFVLLQKQRAELCWRTGLVLLQHGKGRHGAAATPLPSRFQPGFPAAEGRRPRPGAATPRAGPARERHAGSRRQDPSCNRFGDSLGTAVSRCAAPGPRPASPGVGWETRTSAHSVGDP